MRTGQIEGQESYRDQESQEQEYEVRKTKTRTLLTNKREVRPSSKAGVKLEKITEKTGSPNKGASKAGSGFKGTSTK